MTESLAEEVRRFRIKVTAILPDAVDTPLWRQNYPIPRPRDALPPERVAELIVYLVTMPQDVVLVSPVIKSFSPRRPTGSGQRDRMSEESLTREVPEGGYKPARKPDLLRHESCGSGSAPDVSRNEFPNDRRLHE